MNDFHATILYHLRRKRIIGEKHTSYDTLCKGFPRHCWKEARKAAVELIKEGYLLEKPTSYGLQVSLNPTRLPEIDRIIEAFLQ